MAKIGEAILSFLGLTTSEKYFNHMKLLLGQIKTLEKQVALHESLEVQRKEHAETLQREIDLLMEIRDNNKKLIETLNKENELLRVCREFDTILQIRSEHEKVSSL